MVLPFVFPATLIVRFADPEEAKNLAGKVLRLIQIVHRFQCRRPIDHCINWEMLRVSWCHSDAVVTVPELPRRIRLEKSSQLFYLHLQQNVFINESGEITPRACETETAILSAIY
jgi:hypothetical protein